MSGHVASKNIGSRKLLEDNTEDKVRLNKQGSNSGVDVLSNVRFP